GHASEGCALGVGWPPFSLDAPTALAEDLEPHPGDPGAVGQLPDGQASVLGPLRDPLAEGLPGCFVHIALAEVVHPGSGCIAPRSRTERQLGDYVETMSIDRC